MPSVKVNFPAGVTRFVPRAARAGDAPVVEADANGQAMVDTARVMLADLLSAGFTVVTSSGPTAARPTRGTYPGMVHVDSTLGKPVYRNAADDGWVDAGGQPA